MRHILSIALALCLVLISLFSACSGGQSQVVTLSSPVNGSVVPTLSPVLMWGGGESGAYRLMIATDNNFQNIITDISNIREPNYTIPSGRLAESTSYWWKVQAKSGNSASQWSQPWNFQTPGGVAPSKRGIVRISATLDGAAWSGPVNYAISGPFSDTDNSLPWNYSDMEPGTYTISYNYGGPSGATLGNITPAPTQQLTDGGTIKFTLNFYRQSSSGITVNAVLDGSPWSGNINFSLSGPRSNSDVAVPRTYSGLPSGTYTLMYNSGGPSGAILSGITPSATQSLSANGSLVYTLNFSTGQASSLTVSATLNGAPWSGPVSYSITGPASVSQGGVPYTMVSAPAGTYTINFNGGGPAGATLGGIVPSSSITLSGGRSGQFVLNFYTSQQVGNIAVNATLNGTPWSGSIYYTINGPFRTSDIAVPRTYSSVPAGAYTITFTGGGPADASLVSISPAPSQTLASGRAIAFNINFVATPSTGSISVRATLDGKPWQTAIGSGAISYSVHGPRSYSGSSMPAQYSGAPSGQYTLTYNGGGPIGASLSNIYPSPSQFLPAGGNVEFVLDFTGQTRGFVQVQVIYNGAPWAGQIGYVVNGPYVESGTSAPRTFQGAPAGSYALTYRVGGPPGAKFVGVEPPSQILVEGGTAVFTIEFISQMPGPIPGPVPAPRPTPIPTPMPGPIPGPIPIPTPTPTPMPGPLKGIN